MVALATLFHESTTSCSEQDDCKQDLGPEIEGRLQLEREILVHAAMQCRELGLGSKWALRSSSEINQSTTTMNRMKRLRNFVLSILR